MTTATDGSLRSQTSRDLHLEDGARVIVEATDETGIFHVRDTGGVQARFDLLEAIGAAFAQVVRKARGVVHDALARLVLAVEGTQRIDVDTALALIAELVGVLGLVIAYRLRVGRTARFVTHRVDEQRHLLGGYAERGEKAHAHDDHLGIGNWLGGAKALDAHLSELAIATLLRALGAKHGACVPELCRSRTLRHEGVLGDGAHDTRRALGAPARGPGRS